MFSFLFYLVPFLLAALPNPNPNPNGCDFFSQLAIQSRQFTDNGDLADFNEWDYVPTVEYVREEQGKHGGTRMYIRKIGKYWNSQHRSAVQAPQGDPRWIIEVLGKKEAAFFGFEMQEDGTLSVPDVVEFNNAIEKINQKLKAKGLEPISLRLTEAPEKPGSAGYMQRFIEGKIPLARISVDQETNKKNIGHRIHDLSYHTSAIFLPGAVLKHAQEISKEMQLLETFLRKKFNEGLPRPHTKETNQAIEDYLLYLRNQDVIRIDNGTADIQLSYLASLKNNENKDPTQINVQWFKQSVGRLYSSDSTDGQIKQNAPPGSLAWSIFKADAQAKWSSMVVSGFERFDKARARLLVELKMDNDKFNQFFKEYARKRAEENPSFHSAPPMSEEDGCAQIPQRILAIRQAIQELQMAP